MKQISLLLVSFLCFHSVMAQQDDTRNYYLQFHTQTRLCKPLSFPCSLPLMVLPLVVSFMYRVVYLFSVAATMMGGIYKRYFIEANTAPLRSWPELVGYPAAEAEHKIKSDMPMVRLQIVPQNHLPTRDFDRDRVRIYVDATGVVTKPPMVG